MTCSMEVGRASLSSLSLRDQADRASSQRALLYYSRKKEMWRAASFMFLPGSGTYHVHSHCISQVSHIVMTHIRNGGNVTVHFHRLSALQQFLLILLPASPLLSHTTSSFLSSSIFPLLSFSPKMLDLALI